VNGFVVGCVVLTRLLGWTAVGCVAALPGDGRARVLDKGEKSGGDGMRGE
jgi:hypothetical protein